MQFGEVWRGLARFGLVWFGLVWFGVSGQKSERHLLRRLTDLSGLVLVIAFADDFSLNDFVSRGLAGILRAAALQFGQNVEPLDDASERGVLSVQM
jgi:hypothetical protein